MNTKQAVRIANLSSAITGMAKALHVTETRVITTLLNEKLILDRELELLSELAEELRR